MQHFTSLFSFGLVQDFETGGSYSDKLVFRGLGTERGCPPSPAALTVWDFSTVQFTGKLFYTKYQCTVKVCKAKTVLGFFYMMHRHTLHSGHYIYV